MREISSILASIILCTKLVRAVNDWSVPCISGVCSYDLPITQETSSGTLEIWGSAISDITTAAGWEILGCDQNAMEQDIRLVCTSSAATCNHLYSSGGAEGKIVRLPESCGKNAFARVAKAWVPRDQSMPATLATRITRVNEAQPEVKSLRLDTDFHAVDSNQMGTVQFAIRGMTLLYAFNKSAAFLINVTSGTIFKESINCTPPTLGVEISMSVTTHARIPIMLTVDGSLVPPKIKDLTISSAGLSAHVNGSLTLQADVQAILDSGLMTIFEVGLPGLDFPGFFSLGPTFQIDTRAIASFDLAVGMQVEFNYHLDNGQFVYPPRAPRATTNIKNSGLHTNKSIHRHELDPFRLLALQLSATPFVQATGTIEGHLIPTLNLDVSAFKRVKTGISVALDSSAVLNITLEAVSQTHNFSRRHEKLDTKFEKRIVLDHETDPKVADPSSISTPTASNQKFNGCFDADVSLDFSVAADADFFDIIDANTKLTIYQDTIPLYKKCFGNSTATHSDSHARAASEHEKRSLQLRAADGAPHLASTCASPKRISLRCLDATFSSMVQVANQVVSLLGSE